MKENVGGLDRALRWIGGPLLAFEGYARFDGRSGRLLGLAGIFGGGLLLGTALTGVCPVNALLGRNTSRAPVAREAPEPDCAEAGVLPGARAAAYDPEARVQDRV